jgi:hypothetical protein
VGRKVPIITDRKEVDGMIVNTVKEEDVGIKLQIKPTRGKDGVVFTSLHVEISEVLLGASKNTTIYQQIITTSRELKVGEKIRIPFYTEQPVLLSGEKKQVKSFSGHEVWMEVTVSEVK